MSSVPEAVRLAFEDLVFLRLLDASRLALLSPSRLSPYDLQAGLQQAVATLMQDLEPVSEADPGEDVTPR